MLTKEAIIDAEKHGAGCGMYYNFANPKEAYNHYKQGLVRCKKPYSEHESDRVVLLELRRDISNKEAADDLNKIKPLMEGNQIDGFTFMETPQKYRIAKAEKKGGEQT